jgi:type I restriction enzyme R subunit
MSLPDAKPEQQARERIDAQLEQAGWVVQTWPHFNIHAGRGVAIREFPTAHGPADYILYVDARPVGVLEAKPEGHTLAGVEGQARKYAEGFPTHLGAPVHPLPFVYLATGTETVFYNLLDPTPCSRRIFWFHRPETLAEWLAADTLDEHVRALHAEGTGFYTAADDTKPSTLRARLRTLPPVHIPNLWQNKVEALTRLDQSLRDDRPRALIHMATGSGKTLLAVTAIYRLVKFGGARRVLFLVDRGNLGDQAEKEFQGYRTPDDNRKFEELYEVQHLATNTMKSSAKVVITTIQRLYSMLKGERDLDPALEEQSAFEDESLVRDGAKAPLPVVYSATLPPETFDIIVVDECHRSIYTLWRQVLEYFDAYIIGLTATPAAHTYGFFDGNLVMEYPHEKAVADGVNVDFEVYRIRTRITEQGSTIQVAPGAMVPIRDRLTREKRWRDPDEIPPTYAGTDLDDQVVAPDQIRTVVRAFKESFLPEAFPHRENVPKTLIFAKDDSHAEDIVGIVRKEFGKGNDFCQKITYRTTADKPSNLIQAFRNSFEPRIAVTVDMIATGTDIKPIEVVMFMRSVKSRVLFEQMKGRGVRVIKPTELKAVTPDATAKTHFYLVDCVGVTERKLSSTYQLERKPSVPLKELLKQVALGVRDADTLASVASRLARLDKRCTKEDRAKVREVSGGPDLGDLAAGFVQALDGDRVAREARTRFDLGTDGEPTDEQTAAASRALRDQAALPLATNPALRDVISEIQKKYEQAIDEGSVDQLLFAGTPEAAKKEAEAVVQSFEKFVAERLDAVRHRARGRAPRSPRHRRLAQLRRSPAAHAAPARGPAPHGTRPARRGGPAQAHARRRSAVRRGAQRAARVEVHHPAVPLQGNGPRAHAIDESGAAAAHDRRAAHRSDPGRAAGLSRRAGERRAGQPARVRGRSTLPRARAPGGHHQRRAAPGLPSERRHPHPALRRPGRGGEPWRVPARRDARESPTGRLTATQPAPRGPPAGVPGAAQPRRGRGRADDVRHDGASEPVSAALSGLARVGSRGSRRHAARRGAAFDLGRGGRLAGAAREHRQRRGADHPRDRRQGPRLQAAQVLGGAWADRDRGRHGSSVAAPLSAVGPPRGAASYFLSAEKMNRAIRDLLVVQVGCGGPQFPGGDKGRDERQR